MDDKKTPGGHQAGQLMSNWHLLSFAFSASHACTATTLLYSSSLLSPEVAYIGSTLFYVATCVASLFVGVPVLAAVGGRLVLVMGMGLISGYVGLFAWACLLPWGSTSQWFIYCFASCLGGLSTGALWTAQGDYLSKYADLRSNAEGGRQSATAKCASIFAEYYLSFEVLMKVGASMAIHFDVKPWYVFAVMVGCSFLASCLALLLKDLPGQAHKANPLLAAVSLWPDPALWCLAPTSLAFGFSASYLQGYVNATYTRPTLGLDWVGILGAGTVLVAAGMSYLCGEMAIRMGTKGPVLLFGSICFLGISLLSLTLGFRGWHYGLVVPYVLQGAGRAVYESTNMAVFADFFPGPETAGAKGNQVMQSTLSFALCFLLSALISHQLLAVVILVASGAVFPCYLLAVWCRNRQALTESLVGEGSSQSSI